MFVSLHEITSDYYAPAVRKCKGLCSIFGVTFTFIFIMICLAIFGVPLSYRIHVVYVTGSKETPEVHEQFLSIALDTAVIANDFHQFNPNNSKLIYLMKSLSPAFLRIGGTMADRLYFSPTEEIHFKHTASVEDGGECAWDHLPCNYLQKPNFTMNGREWIQLNTMAKSANLDIIFDLNSLRRFDNGSWDYRNAEELIEFSQEHGFNLDWELGNEPNAFQHQFNYSVSADQLALDFGTLRRILQKYPKYQESLLVGPDVTRPQADHKESELYLEEFLLDAGDIVDAVTFHQYYLNGHTAELKDFVDPRVLNVLKWQIATVKQILADDRIDKPIWLGETSSAYGGGAPNISDRFVACFMWLDKLGVAAKYGVDVVIRQSIFGGYYSLLDEHYNPNADYWISLLYKKLVGRKMVDCYMPDSQYVRVYCQCTKNESMSFTIFALNLSRRDAKIRVEGIVPLGTVLADTLMVDSYILTTNNNLLSKNVYLNGALLELNGSNQLPDLEPKRIFANPYVEMPPYSMAFWVIPTEPKRRICV